MLQMIVEQLEACDYQCEAGPLVNSQAFLTLKSLAYLETVAVANGKKAPALTGAEVSAIVSEIERRLDKENAGDDEAFLHQLQMMANTPFASVQNIRSAMYDTHEANQ